MGYKKGEGGIGYKKREGGTGEEWVIREWQGEVRLEGVVYWRMGYKKEKRQTVGWRQGEAKWVSEIGS